MKAIIYKGKTNRLSFKEVAKPPVKKGEALIKVKFAGICRSDVERLESRNWPAEHFPVIPGHEFMGEVVEVFGEHRNLIGKRVVAEPIISCGRCEMCEAGNRHICYSRQLLGVHINGGMAEFVSVPIKNLHTIPDNMDDETASIIEPTAVALHNFNRSGFAEGSSVLIVGAGTVGLLLAQILRNNSAGMIAFLEIDDKRKTFCSELGFDVVDPEKSRQQYDYGFEISGSEKGFFNLLGSLKKRGSMILIGFPRKKYLIDLNKLIFNELDLRGSLVYTSKEFNEALKLLSKNKINARSLITDIFKLSDFNIALEKLKKRQAMKVLLRID